MRTLSALEHNIECKQARSYYYAHKRKETADQPAPLPVHVPLDVVQSAPACQPEPLSDSIFHYQFADEESQVKLYVPIEGIKSICNEGSAVVECTFRERAVEVQIRYTSGRLQRLLLKDLYGPVDPSQSSHKVATNKIIVTLKKMVDETGRCAAWHQLRDNSSKNLSS